MVELSTVAIALLVSLDVGYFLKTFVCTIGSKFFWTRISPLQSSRIYGICTTRDVDFLLNHINNARYLRCMDFGRVDHCVRTGLFRSVRSCNASLLVAANTIRYRKPIFLCMPYKLQSQIVYWDDKNVYYRQDFFSIHDNFLRATAYVKVAVVGGKPETIISDAGNITNIALPHAPSDLLSWIQYNEQSSENLKKLQ